MAVSSPNRAAKRLMQYIDEKFNAWLPQQATVTRTQGGSVWTRFAHEAGDAPESLFRSVFVNTPVGTVGWVVRLWGSKGLFLPTGINMPLPFTKAMTASALPIALSTAGSVIDPSPLVFTGLNPNRQYKVTWTHICRYSSTATGQHRLSVQIVGATTVMPTATYSVGSGSGTRGANASEDVIYPSAAGTITIGPAVIWNSGTTNIDASVISGTIS